jgi:hypothetical protein
VRGRGRCAGVGAAARCERASGRRRSVSAGVGAAALCERGRRGGGALASGRRRAGVGAAARWLRGGGALASGRRRPVRRGVRGGPGRWPAKVLAAGPGGGGAESLERVCACVCALAVCAAGGPRGRRPLGGVHLFPTAQLASRRK